jgi:PPOX class probable F420-dependent enzyme
MPKPPLPDDLQALLRQPNPCVIAILGPDGAPRSAATWYDWLEDGTVMLNMDETRRRLPHMRRDPRVALTILDGESWYRQVSLVGRVREIRRDPNLEDIDRLSRRYLNNPYRDRNRKSWTAIVEIERWHAWDGGHPYTAR